MAIDLTVVYPGQVAPASGAYPQGGAKNETAPGLFDGTPFELAMLNDVFGFEQALLKSANIAPSGNSDSALDKNSSQYLQAVLHLVTSGSTFDESGVADAYVLDVVNSNPAPANYSDNMTVSFIPGNTNTGASTVNIEGLGVKDIVSAGVPLAAGIILADHFQSMFFDAANDRFELHIHGANLGQAEAVDLTLTGVAASPPDSNTLVQENIVKGWINFTGQGTITIRDSYNVASIVDNGTGDYDINWDTDFADVNYAASVTVDGPNGEGTTGVSRTVGTLQVFTTNSGGTPTNKTFVEVIAIGNQ